MWIALHVVRIEVLMSLMLGVAVVVVISVGRRSVCLLVARKRFL